MNKNETRPLLVRTLERARAAEEAAYQGAQQAARVESTWQPVAEAKEEWDRARLARAQAELQLWLADRQWDREELEARQNA